MKVIREIVLAVLVIAAVFFGSIYKLEAQGSSWPGVYRVDGTNPDGGHYTGAVQVEAIPDSELFMLTWSMDAKPCGDAGSADCMIGAAYDHDGTLVVIGQNIQMFGSFKKDLKGKWLIPGVFVPLTEDWTRTDFKELKDAIKAIPGHGGINRVVDRVLQFGRSL